MWLEDEEDIDPVPKSSILGRDLHQEEMRVFHGTIEVGNFRRKCGRISRVFPLLITVKLTLHKARNSDQNEIVSRNEPFIEAPQTTDTIDDK